MWLMLRVRSVSFHGVLGTAGSRVQVCQSEWRLSCVMMIGFVVRL
jgi:hypothetical protein